MAELAERIRRGALRVGVRGVAVTAAVGLVLGVALACGAPTIPRHHVRSRSASGSRSPCSPRGWASRRRRARVSARGGRRISHHPARRSDFALRGGAVSGLGVSSLGLIGFGVLYWGLGSTAIAAPDQERFRRAVTAAGVRCQRRGTGRPDRAAGHLREVVRPGGPTRRRRRPAAPSAARRSGGRQRRGRRRARVGSARVRARRLGRVRHARDGRERGIGPGAGRRLPLLALAVGLIASALGVGAGPALARTPAGALRSAVRSRRSRSSAGCCRVARNRGRGERRRLDVRVVGWVARAGNGQRGRAARVLGHRISHGGATPAPRSRKRHARVRRRGC
jgi:hypothetical protein